MGFNAGIVSDKNLIVCAIPITNCKNVRIAAYDNTSELHLLPRDNRTSASRIAYFGALRQCRWCK
jgi:hypothetical protein